MSWSLRGELILNCNCTVFCPCVVSLGRLPPTGGYCQAWLGVRIDQGEADGEDLSGFDVGMIMDIPGNIGRGNWTGAERAPVAFATEGGKRRLAVGKKIIGEVEPIEGAAPDEEVEVTKTRYWMGRDVTVARADQGRVRAFGRVWDFEGRSAEICRIDWKG